MTDYNAFLSVKDRVVTRSGKEVAEELLHTSLFPFQRDLVRWALRKGRSAIFATTGMGKTRMQVEWARLTGERVLIVAPLAVAQQTVREAAGIGVDVTYSRDGLASGAVTITNYEMVDRFDPAQFGAVVLDESSILKSHDGKTRTALIQQFQQVPYRLCATATPAPNDIAELANHAEFLGIMSRVEMLATFFVHDEKDWRLKGHAREPFYRWLASWGMSLLRPSDLGYDDGAFVLPPLSIVLETVGSDYVPTGQLFATSIKGVGDRAKIRKQTAGERVQRTADLINADRSEPWIAWVGLNDESEMLASLIPDAVEVTGSQSPEDKAALIGRFVDGSARVLITKPSIAGFGMNFQHCARMAFVGMNDSYEQYFQSIRRCYRFGQLRPVTAHIVLSDIEEPIYQNVLRKEREAASMAADLVRHVSQYERSEIGQARTVMTYAPQQPMEVPGWVRMCA